VIGLHAKNGHHRGLPMIGLEVEVYNYHVVDQLWHFVSGTSEDDRLATI